MFVVLIFLFILGLFVGSFLNVLIDRLPREETVLSGRSHCESCKHKLAWYDLIPLLSFIQLKGKCRYCHTSLSMYYPIVEITTGALFVITTNFVFHGVIPSVSEGSNIQASVSEILHFVQNDIVMLSYFPSLIFYFFLVSSLVVIFFIDLKFGIIPDKVLFPAIFISFFFLFINPFGATQGEHQSLIINHFLSAFGAFTFFFLLHVLTRGRGMGFGDVKYVVLMGLVLGFPNTIVGLYIAFLTGAIVSLMLVLWGKKKFRGSTIPFGPFLVFGTLVALFWGNSLIQIALPFLIR